MSGFSVTDERSEKVAFTEPYMTIGQMAIVHRDKVARFGQPWSIYREGVRIGVEPGTTGAAFAESEGLDGAKESLNAARRDRQRKLGVVAGGVGERKHVIGEFLADFDFAGTRLQSFELASPSEGEVLTATATIGGAAGDCVTDSFSVTAPGNEGSPIICGTNTGQHRE